MLALGRISKISYLGEVFSRNSLLAWFGLFNFLALGLLFIFALVDERTLFGINVWIKPMKFCLSIGIFVWTMAWLLDYLPHKKQVKRISLWIVLAMGIEIVIIIGQASMGKASHYNVSSAWDGFLFGMMGWAIVVNTLMVLWALILFFKIDHLPKGYLWAIRLGMAIFLFASMEGWLMIANNAHTVGAADGEEGYFFLNWAKRYGDLRVSHFLGLHAIQVLPLFGWFFSKDKMKPILLFASLYFLLSVGTLWQALAGKSIFFQN